MQLLQELVSIRLETCFRTTYKYWCFFTRKELSLLEDLANNLSKTLKSGKILDLRGLAINISVYIDEVDTILPLNCNWIASNLLPKFDEKTQSFVEPYLPNIKIGIMHLAAGLWKNNQDMRLDKSIKIEIKTLENKSISKSLRYSN